MKHIVFSRTNIVALLLVGSLGASNSMAAGVPSELVPWIGTFRGSCTNDDPSSGFSQSFRGERVVQPIQGTKDFVWKTSFQFGGFPVLKDYKLLTIDLSRGFFLIDEGPIKLDSYLRKNAFYSQFEANGFRLTSTDRLAGDALSIEYLTFEISPNSTTSSDRVTNYPFVAIMRCIMQRAKAS